MYHKGTTLELLLAVGKTPSSIVVKNQGSGRFPFWNPGSAFAILWPWANYLSSLASVSSSVKLPRVVVRLKWANICFRLNNIKLLFCRIRKVKYWQFMWFRWFTLKKMLRTVPGAWWASCQFWLYYHFLRESSNFFPLSSVVYSPMGMICLPYETEQP